MSSSSASSMEYSMPVRSRSGSRSRDAAPDAPAVADLDSLVGALRGSRIDGIRRSTRGAQKRAVTNMKPPPPKKKKAQSKRETVKQALTACKKALAGQTRTIAKLTKTAEKETFRLAQQIANCNMKLEKQAEVIRSMEDFIGANYLSGQYANSVSVSMGPMELERERIRDIGEPGPRYSPSGWKNLNKSTPFGRRKRKTTTSKK